MSLLSYVSTLLSSALLYRRDMVVTVRHTYAAEQKASKKNWTLTARDCGRETWAGRRSKECSLKCFGHCFYSVQLEMWVMGVFYSCHSNLSKLTSLLRHCRDDRCVGDNGREGWYPYLSEEVVSLLQSLHIEQVRHTHLHLQLLSFVLYLIDRNACKLNGI